MTTEFNFWGRFWRQWNTRLILFAFGLTAVQIYLFLRGHRLAARELSLPVLAVNTGSLVFTLYYMVLNRRRLERWNSIQKQITNSADFSPWEKVEHLERLCEEIETYAKSDKP